MKEAQLVFVPAPLPGHLPPAIELAKLLTQREPRLSVSILILELPLSSFDNLVTDSDSIRFITLPPPQVDSGATHLPADVNKLIDAYVPLVVGAIHALSSSNSVPLAGLVIDMFLTSMIDCAEEFGVPSYLFFTCSAAFLGFLFHIQFLHDNQCLDLQEFKDRPDAELEVPSFAHSVPGKVFPSSLFDKETEQKVRLLHHCRRYRRLKGIMVNTFIELESHAIRSFSGAKIPPVYPVGPMLNTRMESCGDQQDTSAILTWLDQHPPSSVVYLCFGGAGSFRADQVKEIAEGLERSGHRFLWSLRQPPPEGKFQMPSDYQNLDEVLPEGFFDRTAGIGKVIGWAPQIPVLAHSAVGGFVSHCGWNSLLESIWYGVPVAAWPMFAEQQVTAFQMVRDLGLAVEIKMDYQRDSGHVVRAHEIENGIREVMDMNSEVRKKRKQLQKISREVLMDGGSSYLELGHFIEDMMANMHHSDDS